MNEIGLIGDIHGCIDPLVEVVDRAVHRARLLVFLGDYVNRGPASRDVIEYLISLRISAAVETRFLVGNHDREFANVLAGKEIAEFLRMGGASTVRNYVSDPHDDVGEQLRAAVPGEHRDFLMNLHDSYADESGLYARHQATAEVNHRYRVFAHQPQSKLIPKIGEREALIDTGCGTASGGRLTCVYWPSLDWEQSSQSWDELMS